MVQASKHRAIARGVSKYFKLGLIIGQISKEYFLPNDNIELHLNSLIEKSRQIKGAVIAKDISITSIETFYFNTYEKPVFTANGTIETENKATKLQLKIDTFYATELASLGIILIAIFGFTISIQGTDSPVSRKGEFFEIAMIVLLIVGVLGLIRVYRRRKKGEAVIDSLISELNNIC